MKDIPEETIDKIKSEIEFSDIIDEREVEILNKQRIEAGINNIILAKIFLTCYDYLNNNISKLGDTENLMRDYLNDFQVDSLRELMIYYEGGENIGDYQIRIRISRIIKKYRKDYENLIGIFFKIFSEEL